MQALLFWVSLDLNLSMLSIFMVCIITQYTHRKKKNTGDCEENCFKSLYSEVMDHCIVIQAFSSMGNYNLKKYVLGLDLKVIACFLQSHLSSLQLQSSGEALLVCRVVGGNTVPEIGARSTKSLQHLQSRALH